jgi:hypothetical protein
LGLSYSGSANPIEFMSTNLVSVMKILSSFIYLLFFTFEVCPDGGGPGYPLLPLKETLHAQAQQRDCYQRCELQKAVLPTRDVYPGSDFSSPDLGSKQHQKEEGKNK